MSQSATEKKVEILLQYKKFDFVDNLAIFWPYSGMEQKNICLFDMA